MDSENCEDKLDQFLRRTYHINAHHDNREGMRTLNSRMESVEVISSKIFFVDRNMPFLMQNIFFSTY